MNKFIYVFLNSSFCTLHSALNLRCHDLYVLFNIVHKEIFSPLRPIFGIVAEQHMIESETEQLLRGQQRHAGLFRRAVAFTLVAFNAGRHEIVRRAFPALGTRENMVERQFLGVLVLTAVLTAIAITDIDPSTFHCRLAGVTTNVNVVTQSND